MSSLVSATPAPRIRAAAVAFVVAALSLVCSLVASIADVDDLYLPAMLLGLVAIVLGVRARRSSHKVLATAAIVVGAWAPATTLVYLVVIGLAELF
jgi:hypothetical protein